MLISNSAIQRWPSGAAVSCHEDKQVQTVHFLKAAAAAGAQTVLFKLFASQSGAMATILVCDTTLKHADHGVSVECDAGLLFLRAIPDG